MPRSNRGIIFGQHLFWRLGALTLWLTVLLASPLAGQELSDEMRGIFEEMMPQLDADLQQKVRNAIRLRRDYLELTADEFKRFRDHPANPFEGWQGINPDLIQGLIRLQFETQPIRSRVPANLERQCSELLTGLAPVTRRVTAGTVRITDGQRQIALGMVVSNEGHIVTKLSEIQGAKSQLFCTAFDDRKFSAEVIAKNDVNDVALLKIAAGELPPVPWASGQPEIGSFIITTHHETCPLALGIYSNPPRSLVGQNQAWLGVKPVTDRQGVKIVEVTAGSSADKAGLELNDILLSINGKPLTDVQGLVNEIRRNSPGDKVVVEYLRDGVAGRVVAELAGRNVGGPTADRFKQMETFGAIPSQRRDGFPMVFQHDTPLVPEQCGGPVTNLQGEVIGMNIARGGRVASYAIPGEHLQQLLGDMLRPNVASKDID